jgi:hypothetical protein
MIIILINRVKQFYYSSSAAGVFLLLPSASSFDCTLLHRGLLATSKMVMSIFGIKRKIGRF